MDSYKQSATFSGMFPSAVVAGAERVTAGPAVASTFLQRHASPFARVSALVATSPAAATVRLPPHAMRHVLKCGGVVLIWSVRLAVATASLRRSVHGLR